MSTHYLVKQRCSKLLHYVAEVFFSTYWRFTSQIIIIILLLVSDCSPFHYQFNRECHV